MSYFLIKNNPIFITWEKTAQFRRIIANDKKERWEKTLYLVGGINNKQVKEIEGIIFDKLTKIYNENPSSFKNDWYNFDLEGENAQFSIKDLLHDYCDYHNHGSLSGSNILHLEFKLKNKNIFKKLFFDDQDDIINILIDTNTVARIKGNLDNFTIYTDSFNLVCNRNIQIYPNDSEYFIGQ